MCLMIQVEKLVAEGLPKKLLPRQANDTERERLHKALQFANNTYGDKKRASGETYLEHGQQVAASLAELGIEDADTIIAALLHDVLQPFTGISEREVANQFGQEVTSLIKGINTLDNHSKEAGRKWLENEAKGGAGPNQEGLEAIRKALLTIIDGDIRIIVIRMIDCLQDLRRADRLPPAMKREVAFEAMKIYAPLANRLGIWHLKSQLEDNAFSYLEPEQYLAIARHVDKDKISRGMKVERAATRLQKRLKNMGLKTTVTGRPKHIYSIYRKMQRKGLGVKDVSKIYDIEAIRVIIEPQEEATVKDDKGKPQTPGDKRQIARTKRERDDLERDLCYQVLGAVHSLWKPIQGEFDDYIASPKANGYKSLHTAVINSETGQVLEVQIRTLRMHEEAERGIAAHWAYKEQNAVSSAAQKQIQNLRDLLVNLQEDEEDGEDFIEVDKPDERIHVYSPTGQVLDLPAGSTPIDYAYHIHTELGHRCRGARVNGKPVGIDYQLQSGDKVEIIEGKRGGPSRDWMSPSLGYTGSSRTRSKIRQWFRQQERAKNIEQGREVVHRELKRLGLTDVFTVEDICRALKFDDLDEFLSKVGFGDIHAVKITGAIALMQQSLRAEDEELLPLFKPPSPKRKGLTVRGVEGLYTRFAGCCNPLPPDPIVGYITRGQGVSIHAQNCDQLQNIRDTERFIEVEWGTEDERYPIPIVVTAYRRGTLIEDLVSTLRGQQINVPKTKLVTSDNLMTVYLIAEVADINQLNWLMTKLGNLRKVLKVERRHWS